MKIGNPLDLFRTGAPVVGAAAPEADKTRAKTAETGSQPVRSEGSATVKLSREFATLKAIGNADGAFDAKRVEQLQAAIANGSFKVDAEVVASNLISSNLDALTRSKH